MVLLIIFCAQYLVYVMALAFAAFLVWKFSWDKLAVTVVSLPLAYGLAKLAGHFYSHIQPFVVSGVEPLIPHVIDNTFPSDHMLLAAAVASLAFAYNRTLGLVLWVCALAVGIARVAALLHYPVDIMASAVIAAVVVWATYVVVSRFLRRGMQHQQT